jgi:VanZ family protein
MITAATSRHKFRTLWLAIGWGLVVLVIYLSLVSGPLPIDVIARGESAHRLIYGIAHVLAYGCLMLWFLQLYPCSRRTIIASGLIALGTVLEGLQGFTVDRYPGYLDLVANTAGVTLGWLLGKTRLARTLETIEERVIRLAA